MIFYVLGFALVLLALLGAPLFSIILALAMIGFHWSGIDLSVIAIELYRIADTPLLLTLPLFTLAGYILGESQASKRLVRLTRVFMGWMPGGLAIVSLIACAMFTAFTGASGVTIVALGALLFPALTQAGYDEKFSLGLVTTSGSLGLLFAPSLPLILYGIIAQQINSGHEVSITDLFLAGLMPGVLMLILLSFLSIWGNRKNPIPKGTFSGMEALAAIREAAWEIPLPFFVIGGIYGGFFVVSEVAAVTAIYIIIIEVWVHREIKVAQLPKIMRESMVMCGGILIVIGVSLGSTNFLIDAEIPMHLFKLIQIYVTDQIVFLLLLNLLLLVLGAILDIFSALVIMVPLILPVALGYGINPIHLGIIFLANMQIGYFTPPVGMNLFIASYRFNKPVTTLYYAAIPFMLVLLIALMIITYWPDLSLFLVD